MSDSISSQQSRWESLKQWLWFCRVWLLANIPFIKQYASSKSDKQTTQLFWSEQERKSARYSRFRRFLAWGEEHFEPLACIYSLILLGMLMWSNICLIKKEYPSIRPFIDWLATGFMLLNPSCGIKIENHDFHFTIVTVSSAVSAIIIPLGINLMTHHVSSLTHKNYWINLIRYEIRADWLLKSNLMLLAVCMLIGLFFYTESLMYSHKIIFILLYLWLVINLIGTFNFSHKIFSMMSEDRLLSLHQKKILNRYALREFLYDQRQKTFLERMEQWRR